MSNGALCGSELLHNYLRKVVESSTPDTVANGLERVCLEDERSVDLFRHEILMDLEVGYRAAITSKTPVYWSLATMATVAASTIAKIQGYGGLAEILSVVSLVPFVAAVGTRVAIRDHCKWTSFLSNELQREANLVRDVVSSYRLSRKYSGGS